MLLKVLSTAIYLQAISGGMVVLRMPPVSMMVIGPFGPIPPGSQVIFSTDPAAKIALEDPLYGTG